MLTYLIILLLGTFYIVFKDLFKEAHYIYVSKKYFDDILAILDDSEEDNDDDFDDDCTTSVVTLETAAIYAIIEDCESLDDLPISVLQLDITPTTSTPQAFLGEMAIESHCSCENEEEWENSTCPRTIAIQIPCFNQSLWSAAVEILRNTLENNEFEFWMQFRETKIGLLLLKLIIGQKGCSANNELSPLFQTNVTYTVSTSVPKYVKVQEEITIKDTLSQGTVQHFIHIDEGAPSLLSFLLTLTSKDEHEIRTHQISIKEIPSEHDFFDDPPLKESSKGKISTTNAKSKTASLKSVM